MFYVIGFKHYTSLPACGKEKPFIYRFETMQEAAAEAKRLQRLPANVQYIEQETGFAWYPLHVTCGEFAA